MGGNLPYMNFPGPKIWASAGVVPLSSRYSWQPIVSQVTSVMLNIVAVWLLTSGVDAPSRLRFYARWVPVLSIGLLAGIAAQARGGTIFNWNIAEQDRSKFYAIVTVICEVPGTFLLYLLLSRLATQLGCRALAMKSLALGALVVACVSAGPAMFLLRGASRGDRTSWLVLLMARRTARRTAPW